MGPIMNVKNNKRRQETINNIERVFMDLLENQEISHIKVTDICKRTGINRGTFYANFEDIYDLAEKMRCRLKNEVNDLFEKDVKSHDIEDDFLKLFEHIKDNQTLYSFYFKLGFDDGDDLKLYEIYQRKHNIYSGHLGYHITFFKSGFNAIVKKWLDGGCRETPQEMKDILLCEYRGRFEINADI